MKRLLLLALLLAGCEAAHEPCTYPDPSETAARLASCESAYDTIDWARKDCQAKMAERQGACCQCKDNVSSLNAWRDWDDEIPPAAYGMPMKLKRSDGSIVGMPKEQ